MKKFLFKIIIMLSILTLVGCDTRKDKDIEISTRSYIDTSETIIINEYNKYKLVKSEIIKNEDGSYSINIKLDKPIK